MKISILLLIMCICIASAKYIPQATSDDRPSRINKSDFDESAPSIEHNSSENDDDDDDDSNDDDSGEKQSVHSQIDKKQEKLHQKLLAQQEKERLRQAERQRRLEEKRLKEERKELEKMEKEERKRLERLEKEKRKQEEAQRKAEEKLKKAEKKREESIQKQLNELKNDLLQDSEEDFLNTEEESSVEVADVWRNHIYVKYGLTLESTRLEKQTALNKYLQEELGLNSNSTSSERRQAIVNLIKTKLNADPVVQEAIGKQLVSHLSAAGIEKMRTDLEKEIEELNNKTNLLSNVSLPWAAQAKTQLQEKRSFLFAVAQYLSSILPKVPINQSNNGNGPLSTNPNPSGINSAGVPDSLITGQLSPDGTDNLSSSGDKITTDLPTYISSRPSNTINAVDNTANISPNQVDGIGNTIENENNIQNIPGSVTIMPNINSQSNENSVTVQPINSGNIATTIISIIANNGSEINVSDAELANTETNNLDLDASSVNSNSDVNPGTQIPFVESEKDPELVNTPNNNVIAVIIGNENVDKTYNAPNIITDITNSQNEISTGEVAESGTTVLSETPTLVSEISQGPSAQDVAINQETVQNNNGFVTDGAGLLVETQTSYITSQATPIENANKNQDHVEDNTLVTDSSASPVETQSVVDVISSQVIPVENVITNQENVENNNNNIVTGAVTLPAETQNMADDITSYPTPIGDANANQDNVENKVNLVTDGSASPVEIQSITESVSSQAISIENVTLSLENVENNNNNIVTDSAALPVETQTVSEYTTSQATPIENTNANQDNVENSTSIVTDVLPDETQSVSDVTSSQATVIENITISPDNVENNTTVSDGIDLPVETQTATEVTSSQATLVENVTINQDNVENNTTVLTDIVETQTIGDIVSSQVVNQDNTENSVDAVTDGITIPVEPGASIVDITQQ